MIRYSELRNSPRQPLAKIVPLACPMTLYVDPTSFCNFKCVQCPVGQAEYDVSPVTMRLETFHRICDEVREMGRLKSLKLYLQGEPLLHPEIAGFVWLGRSIADRVEITSNCSVLNEVKAQALVDVELDFLQVSVYGASEVQHNSVTNSVISAERVRKNVMRLKEIRDSRRKRKPFIYARFFHSAPDIEALFLKEWEPIADECGFDTVHDWDGQFNMNQRLYGIGEHPPASDMPCPFPFYTLTVKANGKVTVCCVDWSDAAEVGNINQESLSEIWNGERLREFRLMHLARQRGGHKACGQCRIPEREPEADSMASLSAEDFQNRLTRP